MLLTVGVCACNQKLLQAVQENTHAIATAFHEKEPVNEISYAILRAVPYVQGYNIWRRLSSALLLLAAAPPAYHQECIFEGP